MSAGIDYGMGQTNVNPKTGIRYGVVSLNSLADWVFDEFFYKGENLTMQAIEREYRATHDIADDEDLPDEFLFGLDLEEEEFSLEIDGMRLELSYLGGAPLVWVLESPITAKCKFCSPCVPGAGDLDNQTDDGIEAYSLPAEWWERA